MSGEINLNIDDIAISESVRPYVRKIDSQEQFRLPNPEEIPDAINYSVKKCIDSASFIPWESVLKKDYIFEDDDVSGLVCFKIPEDIQLIPLF